MIKTLIVGYGFVGKATEYMLEFTDAQVSKHDPLLGYEEGKEKKYDFVFLCVPTPDNGKHLDTTLLEKVYEEWKGKGQIIIRSTIGPDQVSLFPDADFMPEFLREKHWREDVVSKELPIVTSNKVLGEYLQDFFMLKDIHIVSGKEAMMFKLARNTALAMRVALANDFYDICEEQGMDYESIEKMLSRDVSIGGSHWKCPGPDGGLGFGGKCLPKDLTHMANLCNNTTYHNHMLEALKQNTIRRVRQLDKLLSGMEW